MSTKILLFDEKKHFPNYTLVEGFPGVGLIGTISVKYLIQSLGMKHIGYVLSDKYPPIATIEQGISLMPVRIYQDKKNKLLAITSDFPFPTSLVNPTVEAIVQFVKSKKIKRIISLSSVTTPTPTGKIFGIASNRKMLRELKKYEIDIIEEGVTTGISGTLISKCALENFNAVSLLAETHFNVVDPIGAIELLKKFMEITGITFNLEPLIKEAEEFQEKIRKMLEQAKRFGEEYEKTSPMYR